MTKVIDLDLWRVRQWWIRMTEGLLSRQPDPDPEEDLSYLESDTEWRLPEDAP